MWTFDWHIYFWPWPILKTKGKVMHILTVDISKMVTDRVNITIAIKYEVTHRLLINIFRFDRDQF